MAAQRPLQYNVYQSGTSSTNTLAQSLINIRQKNLDENVVSYLDGSGHKLEYVKTINGVDFINDSCSQTANAVWYALDSMTKRVTWIMSMDKVDTFTDDLLDIIEEKVGTIVLHGVYNTAIIEFFTELGKQVLFSMNMEEAVRTAFYNTNPGSVVLFSPGVACHGDYPSYRERGDKFKEAIAQL